MDVSSTPISNAGHWTRFTWDVKNYYFIHFNHSTKIIHTEELGPVIFSNIAKKAKTHSEISVRLKRLDFPYGVYVGTQVSNKQKSVNTCIPRQRIQGATFTRYVSM